MNSEFEKRHPGCWPGATRFELTDTRGNILESWEKNADGIWKEVTQRDLARKEIVKAQEELERILEKERKLQNGQVS